MAEEPGDKGRKHTINLTPSQVAASALAASCSAIVASYLGVAGTVIGAAVGSVVATIGAAIYGHLLRSSGSKIKTTLASTIAEQEAARGGGDHYPTAPLPRPQSHTPAYRPQSDAPRAYTHPAYRPQASIPYDQDPTAYVSVPLGGGQPADPTRAAAPQAWVPQELTEAPDPIWNTPQSQGQYPSASTSPSIYRRPVFLAGAIVLVFAVAISIGFLLGGPVRQAGADRSAPPPNPVRSSDQSSGEGRDTSTHTTPSTPGTPTATPTGTGGNPTQTATGSPSGTATATPSGSLTVAPTEPGATGSAAASGASPNRAAP